MSTEAQLKALSNSELASGTQIPALKHRTVNDAIIEEMYDAQSRGNVLSGVQTAPSLASGDEVFVIRSGEAYLLDANALGFVDALADLTDVNIPSPANDQVLAYNFGTSKWVSKDVSSLSSVVSITGTATTNQMVKFTGLSSIGNSIVSDNGTTVNIGGNLSVDNNLTVGTINSGTATDFVKGDGSLDGTTYQDESEKNQANGYAPLDSGAKIPLANLPDSILGQVSYQGTWAASTNTPTLANPPASTTKGEYYVASDDGTQFGIDFKTGDWIISNGTAWEKVDNTDAVTSVFGRLGNIIALQEDYDDFYVTLDTAQSITGQKTFGTGDLRLVSGGSGNLPTIFSNSSVGSSQETGSNTLGFNGNNNLFFTKGETVDFNGSIIAYDNTGIRTYTLPDASGTFAFTSDLGDYVTLATTQTITGQKTFGTDTLRVEAEGTANTLRVRNVNSVSAAADGFNLLGFNQNNDLYFSKAAANTAVISYNNTTSRTYTLPDTSGTLALTSDLNNLNASNITTGTLADARLSSNVALKDIDNNFSVGQTIGGDTTINGSTTINGDLDVNSGQLIISTASDRPARFESSDSLSYIQINDTSDSVYVGVQSNIGTIGGSISGSTNNIQIDLTNGNTTINGSLTVDNTLNSTIRLNASDTTILSGDNIGTIEWYTNDPSSSGTGVSAQIQAFAENDFAGGNRNTSIAFSTVLGTGSLTERMRIDSSGYLRLAGAGIQFNGDTAAANALDDYEEGTFTAEVADATTGGNIASISTNACAYTKIGNVVNVSLILGNIDTTGMTGGNTLFFRDLPFTIGEAATAAVQIDGITFSGNYVIANAVATTSYFTLKNVASGSSDLSLDVSSIDSSASDVVLSMTYLV